MKYPSLFQPIEIAGQRIKNRIAMAPINNSSQMNPVTGQATMTMVDYFAERARGGAGMLITGVFKVEYEIEQCVDLDAGVRKWCYFSPQSTRELGELAARVHAYDCKLYYQLSAGPGRVTPADTIHSGVQPVSASENECFFAPDVLCRALETGEVEQIVAAFGSAGAFARTINADGIEVHGHEGYLIDQFTTALWNRRDDKYGGDLHGRLTFPIEILRAIKAAAGPNFPVIYRMGVRHFIERPLSGALHESAPEVGRDIQEAVAMAKALEAAGYDGFSVDVGAYESSYWAHPPNYFPRGFAVELTAAIKAAVSVPVIVAGRLGTPELAERVVAEGKADMVALARDILADPEWPNKVARGDVDDIRPCIGCHDGCMDRPRMEGVPLSCSVNPAASRERISVPLRTRRGKRILVVGGGPAGMEFSRIAAERGHAVTLAERSDRLGGHMLEYGVPAFKDDIKRLTAWYRRQIQSSSVDVRYSTDVDLASVSHFDPEIVVLAAGSTYRLPASAPAAGARVVACTQVLRDPSLVIGDVVVIGGGSHGCETALWLTRQGHAVTILEAEASVLTSGMNRINRALLVDLLVDEGAQIEVQHRFTRFVAGGIEFQRADGRLAVMPFGTAVMAIGATANTQLYDGLLAAVPEVFHIGDCKQPRKIYDAIHEGWRLGMNI